MSSDSSTSLSRLFKQTNRFSSCSTTRPTLSPDLLGIGLDENRTHQYGHKILGTLGVPCSAACTWKWMRYLCQQATPHSSEAKADLRPRGSSVTTIFTHPRPCATRLHWEAFLPALSPVLTPLLALGVNRHGDDRSRSHYPSTFPATLTDLWRRVKGRY